MNWNEQDLSATREHQRCVMCGQCVPNGLRLCFTPVEDDSVEAEFQCSDDYQGYTGLLHGGMISAMLDAAMTNCLFALGVEALTADLRIRFRMPVPTNARIRLRASLLDERPPLYRLAASLLVDGVVYASAEGKFMERAATSVRPHPST